MMKTIKLFAVVSRSVTTLLLLTTRQEASGFTTSAHWKLHTQPSQLLRLSGRNSYDQSTALVDHGSFLASATTTTAATTTRCHEESHFPTDTKKSTTSSSTAITTSHHCRLRRRSVLRQVSSSCLAFFAFSSRAVPVVHAATTGQIKTSQYAGKTRATAAAADPQQAFQGLLRARAELVEGERLVAAVAKKKNAAASMEEVRTYLTNDATNMIAFQSNCLSILASKRLSDEDKKTIGTIRRYGVGADVIIMYGGATAEVDEMNDEPDPAVVKKYLARARESLDEVISICRSNGF